MPLPLSVDANGVAYMAYDSTNDRAIVEPGVAANVSAGVTFTQTNATFTYVNSVSAANYRHRGIYCVNTTDKVLTVTVNMKAATGGGTTAILQFTLAIGNVTPQVAWITSAGAFAGSGSAPTKTAGDYSLLDFPGAAGATIAITGSTTSATVGTSECDLIQFTV